MKRSVMKACLRWSCLAGFGVTLAACSLDAVERNPFLGYTEEYGVAGQQQRSDEGAAGGAGTQVQFRREMTITFRNNAPEADLNTTLVAWVNVSSVRSAQQQDALLRGGYVQLTREIQLGTAHTLPIGTLVYEGGGTAGASAVFLRRANSTGGTGAEPGQQQGEVTPTVTSITLVTPDAILLFSEPPVSCESVAFYFTGEDGLVLTAEPVADPEAPFAGATGRGGYKTLAQIDVYECQPLRPGVFFNFGGARKPNEYYEGENVTVDFYLAPQTSGYCGVVTIGQTTTPPTGQ